MAAKSSDSASGCFFEDGSDTTFHNKSAMETSDVREYFDVLLLGKTGMGKSTTGNKLINSYSASQFIHRWEIEGEESDLLPKRGEDGEPKYFEEEKENSTESTTTMCELLSDESGELDGTKFRVLDVEGFAPTNQTEGMSCKQENLSILRKVVKVQNALDLCFSRVLYFLPSRGRLQKADYNITDELDVLHFFFGNDIFDAMIVIATEDPLDEIKEWPQNKLQLTKQAFLDALSKVIGRPRNFPDPQIMFISCSATPRDVRKLIKCTDVKCKSLVLKFRDGVCHRCGLEFTSRTIDGKIVGITCTTDTGDVPYDQTKCHPIIVIKHTDVEKLAANVVHIATLGATYVHRKTIGMPGFRLFSSSEWCPHCQQKPGSPGCSPVKQIYEYYPRESAHRITILVNHSSDFSKK